MAPWYQTAQLAVIQGVAALESAQDNFKFTLGLPMSLPIRLDDSLLASFQLNDPRLESLQDEIDKYFTSFREPNQALPLPRLQEGYKNLKTFQGRAVTLLKDVAAEVEQLRKQLAEPAQDKQDREEEADKRRVLTRLSTALGDARTDLDKLGQDIDKALATLATTKPLDASTTLQLYAQRLRSSADELFVIQTQVRVYLIKLKPIQYGLADAVEYAKANRLDLMNAEARVVDAWRQIAVTASQLKAGFDVMFNANIATPGLNANPVDFRASASTYSVGFHFEAPLNRLVERNAYRASLISYEQARRTFMAAEDGIEQQIRQNVRNLNTNRINFEIARQSLVSAAQQVQSARADILQPNADPTSTINYLNALNSLLTAKNQLIGAWVSYEVGRYQLLLDMEALQLDDRGWYTDEHDDRTNQPATVPVSARDQQTPVAAVR